MKPRFQADADLRYEIVSGVLRREPAIDFRRAQDRLADGMGDPLVLRVAADDGRIVVSHDLRTMPGHFLRFVTDHGRSPGMFLIPQSVSTVEAIEELVMIWALSDAEEWENRIVWLPL